MNSIFGKRPQKQPQSSQTSGNFSLGQVVDFINSRDPSTAYEEAQQLIKERGLSKGKVDEIVNQAKSIISMLGLK